MGPACHPGAFPVQAPDKAPETSTWSPGSQGGRSLPGRNLAGNQIACRLVGEEPAHDLDIETLERLESLPVDYQGTVLLVSRDRDRLDDVAARTLVIEDDGLVIEQEAGHDGDLRHRPAEPAYQSGPDPDDPGSKAADVSREQSRKLSVNERHEPDSMPGRIEQLEKSTLDRHAALAGRSFHRAGWVAAGAGLPGRTEILKSRRGVWICHLGPLWGACIGCVQPINKVWGWEST